MKTIVSLLAATVMTGTAVQAHAGGPDCEPNRMEIILDKSSSMQTGSIGGVTKWNIARNALDAVTREFESSLEMGLVTFPEPAQCSAGTEKVFPALNSRAAIMAELATPPPTGGNWTPMFQTLDAAAEMPSLTSGNMERYVVFISDGWQYCIPEDPSTRFRAVESIGGLNDIGVTSYVVGFGDSVDVRALNQMAVRARTARPGCNPDSTTTGGNNCYYQADNQAELLAALRQIATDASEEVCDGEDNDCDGLVDENLNRECESACGTGTETCTDGSWHGCDAPQPESEICDNLDNDCDGATDEGCDCAAGSERVCGDPLCGSGAQRCKSDGTWGGCDGDPQPSSEACDGEDNDCDGETDEFDGSDDVGSLCPAGQRCDLDGCVDVEDEEPVSDEPGVDRDVSGCGCHTTTAQGGVGAGLLLLGVALVFRRRRR